MPDSTVLLVEGDENLRKVYVKMLGRAGFAVRAVQSAVAAVDELEHYVPDLLMTDLAMPRVSGIDLIFIVRTKPRLSRLPIIIMTAYGDELPDLASISGATKTITITKPFTYEELCAAINSLLSKNPNA